MYNRNNHNTRNTTTTQKFKFNPPDWTAMSVRQKMAYVQNELAFIYKKMKAPDADIQYWRHQLSYFLWLPIRNSLNLEEARKCGSKKEEYISKGVSKFLFTLCEARIPLERKAALEAVSRMYQRVRNMIDQYDLRAVNSLRGNIGLEPETRFHNLELFNQIFSAEIAERQEQQHNIA